MSGPTATQPQQAELEALEASLLETLETLDRLEEFTEPSLQPDTAGLALNLCAAAANAPREKKPLMMHARGKKNAGTPFGS